MEERASQFVVEQTGSFKSSNVAAVILVVAFVVLLGVGSTYAYMRWTGNQTPNRFTVDKGLNVDLVEPAWTKALNLAANGYPNVASDGSTKIPAGANNFGGIATDGQTAVTKVAKDPYVVNTSMVGNEIDKPGCDAYVGIRLTFQKWVATKTDGTGESHTEEGKYVKMTQDEVEAFFKCYQLNVDGNTQKKTDASGQAVVESYGVVTDASWKQYVLNDDGEAVESSAVAPQMYFIYSKAIKSVGKSIEGEYPAAGNSDKTATTSLFKFIQLVNNDAELMSNFNALLRVTSDGTANVTTDPGFRILVDTAAVDSVSESLDTAPTGDRLSALCTEDSYLEVTESGASPTFNNKYWSESTQKTKGSGYGDTATNAPESHWSY